jgi:large subunit ribosomal protein L17
MRHLKAHRKLGRTTEHRISLLRNLATSLIIADKEYIITTISKAKELRPFVEKVITLARRAENMTGDDAAVQRVHLRRQAARFFTPETAALKTSRAVFAALRERRRSD